MILNGKVFKYGDNVDTDVIIPARYLNITDPGDLASHCLEDLDPNFSHQVKPGDIIVAGKNFGSGSSREHAPLAIKAAGVSCVIAESFARIFFRNAFNIGLPILECKEASKAIENGVKLTVDLNKGVITNLSEGDSYQAEPIPPFIQEIIHAGGLIAYVKGELTANDN